MRGLDDGCQTDRAQTCSGDHLSRAALHLREAGYDVRVVQVLLGDEDVSTPMIDTHVLNKRGRGVTSPLDA